MKSKKLIYIIIAIVIVSGGIITINRFIDRFYIGNNRKSIYTDNSKIVALNDNYSYLYKRGINEKGYTNMSFKFSGMETIWEISSKNDSTINIEFDSKIESGKFKVVLIDPNDNVIKILEQSQEGRSKFDIKKGNSRIKVIGSDCKGKLKINITTNEEEDIDIVDVY